MSIIIPANSAAGGGFAVDNSCRFDGSSSKLVKAESAGNRQRWTYSVWLKRSAITTTTTTFFASSNGGTTYSYLGIQSDKIRWLDYDGGNNSNLITNAVFRDPSAWYHIVFVFNSNLGSGETDKEERTKLYINGVRETSFGTAAYAGQNQDSGVNVNSSNFIIGSNQDQSSASTWNGYMAEAHFIDGTAYQADSFGEFDSDSGVWKPIEVSGLTYGTNGFYLDFKDGDNLGNDANGGTDFTESGLTAIDQTTDTPTNNFATLNGVAKGAGSTFAEGNLKVTTTISNYNSSVASIGVSSGKWYWEMKLGNSGGSGGVTNYSMYGITTNSPVYVPDLSQEAEKWTYLKIAYGGTMRYNETGGSYVQASYGSANSGNDIVMMALDLDNNFIYMGANGSWYNSGNPTSGASGTGAAPRALVAGNTYFPSFTTSYGTNLEVNFGNAPYAISSGNTDGNDRGNFEYAPPSGYLSLCTANLSEVLG